MTALDLLTTLRQRGVTLEALGDRLRFYPADRVPPALLTAIRERKGDLLALLRGETPRIASADSAKRWDRGDSAESAEPIQPSENAKRPEDEVAGRWDWLVAMPRSRFEAGRFIVWLWSEVLQERIALVSRPDLLPRVQAAGCVGYLPDEIEVLAAHPLNSDTLRKTHATKKALDGRITGLSGPAG